ncbi:MAG: hypothetical protein METHAR1v1_880020 [Methanothrix sp.]|nr:MAG: hypothetical protein METHAR1v1_880020 [Methanothrix sp.]
MRNAFQTMDLPLIEQRSKEIDL